MKPWIIVAGLLGIVTGAALFGCGQSPPASSSSKATPATEKSDAEPDLHDLRSIPYADGVSSDEEDEEGIVLRDPARSAPGYSLFTVQKLCTAILMDEKGETVRSWKAPPGGRHWANVELLPDGDLLAIGADAIKAPAGAAAGVQAGMEGLSDEYRYMMRFNWAGELLWRRDLMVHHDAEITPDGKILTLVLARRKIDAIHPQVETRDDELTLLSADGETLESLSLYDIVSKRPDLFPLNTVRPTRTPDGAWVDLFHCNSIEWFRQKHLVGNHPVYDPGAVLVCSRHQNRIFLINWEKRELLWAWGQNELDGPHDATFLPNGHILVFDNGLARRWTRVIQLDPVSNRIVWEYKADPPSDFYTPSKGSNQRLPGGTTLISNSDNAEAFEVTPEGEIVWRFLNPERLPNGQRATIVRMYRFPSEFIRAIEAAQ